MARYLTLAFVLYWFYGCATVQELYDKRVIAGGAYCERPEWTVDQVCESRGGEQSSSVGGALGGVGPGVAGASGKGSNTPGGR